MILILHNQSSFTHLSYSLPLISWIMMWVSNIFFPQFLLLGINLSFLYLYKNLDINILYFLFKSLLMRNRNKFDWTKPFKFAPTKREFDELDTNDENLIIVIPTEDVKPVVPYKKQEIIVPKIDVVNRVTEVKSFAKITPNYIRLPAHLNLPLANNYELTEVDHTFLKSHQDRFIFKGKKILTQEFLKKAITELQLKAGKDMTLPRNKGWMVSFLQKEYKDILQLETVEQLAETVYNYWKNRREELKFPLLRLLWKPNPDEYNHMLAFRPRQREKRSLRRTNRVVQEQIIEQLADEFDLAAKIVERVQMREQLKLKHANLQLYSFYAECKNYLPMPDYLQELRIQDRSKDKERMRALHSSLENYKSRKESLENIVVQEPIGQEVDQKQSIVNFLSTVIYEAEQLGISYEKIYLSNNTFVDSKPRPTNPITIPSEPIVDKIVEEPKNIEQHCSFSMKRVDDLLIRTFEEEDSPIQHIKPCKNYLQLKRRKVDRFYFGSDDEGETKDLRKNISASFKKYLQLQHITRTISANSQN